VRRGSPTGAPRGRALARNFDAEVVGALRRILARHRGSVATITARRILKEMGLGFTSARASAILATIRTVHEVDGWRLVEEGRGERVYLRFARRRCLG
jgi:plasmid stability protein